MLEVSAKLGKVYLFKCICSCGRYVYSIRGSNLCNGNTKSCGCLRDESVKTTNIIHGQAKNKQTGPEYRILAKIKERCYNKNSKSYKDYGGRGIKLYAPWKDFTVFYSYLKSTMGTRPTPKHTIERIDNNRDYEPNNIRWATRAEQNRNKRNNRTILFNGRIVKLVDLATQNNIKPALLRQRLDRDKMPIEKALSL